MLEELTAFPGLLAGEEGADCPLSQEFPSPALGPLGLTFTFSGLCLARFHFWTLAGLRLGDSRASGL